MATTTPLYLQQIASIVPGLLVSLMGIVAAIVFLGSYPRPAVLVLAAFILRIVTSVATTAVPMLLYSSEQPGQIATWFGVINLLASLFHAAAVLLLIIAAFIDRAPRTS